MNISHNSTILKIEGLKTFFYTKAGIARAVDGVSLTVKQGETLGIVGESGCGKSVTALSVMGLIPNPPGKIVEGSINFSSHGDLNRLTESEMRRIRGNQISMIFQEPMTSLNPVYKIGRQIAESVRLHLKTTKNEAWDRSVEMLKMVGIPLPEKRANSYPHQLSGGMRQRVMIAMALSCRPTLMLADEPTTALDVTIQAQILHLMNKLKEAVGTSIILITHDLGVIAKMAQRVCVMYAGVIVETADIITLFSKPQHPYTKGLLTSMPRADRDAEEKSRLNTIPGIVPSLLDLPAGCRFSDRCTEVHETCMKYEPTLAPLDDSAEGDHQVRCWLYQRPPKGT